MPKVEMTRWDSAKSGPPEEAYFYDLWQGLGYRVTRYVYPPGTVFPAHTHTVDKIDVVLSGSFKVSMYGETLILEAGDRLLVPRGAVHSASVVGDEPVVSLDAVKLRECD